jgi:hypothetical protein
MSETTEPGAPSPVQEHLASARAIVEALVGVPIVLSQQLVQNLGDIKLPDDTTVHQKVAQLRMLGEMTVRIGERAVRHRIDGLRR